MLSLSREIVLSHVIGSPTAVANLWDVTDVDIDRFASAVLDCWLGADQEQPQTTTAGGRIDDAIESKRHRPKPSDSSTAAAVLNLADAVAHPGVARPGVLQGSAHDGRGGMCIAETVAMARDICRLPHLIGSAPVCYGVPTQMWAA